MPTGEETPQGGRRCQIIIIVVGGGGSAANALITNTTLGAACKDFAASCFNASVKAAQRYEVTPEPPEDKTNDLVAVLSSVTEALKTNTATAQQVLDAKAVLDLFTANYLT